MVELHRVLLDSPLAGAGLAESAGWTCHHYGAGQSHVWCAAAGIQNGVEFKLTHGDGTCGLCECCARLRLLSPSHPSQGARVEAKYAAGDFDGPTPSGKLAWLT